MSDPLGILSRAAKPDDRPDPDDPLGLLVARPDTNVPPPPSPTAPAPVVAPAATPAPRLDPGSVSFETAGATVDDRFGNTGLGRMVGRGADVVDRFLGRQPIVQRLNRWRDAFAPDQATIGTPAQPIDQRTVTEQAEAAKAQGAQLITSAAAADVSGTPGAQIVPATHGGTPTTARTPGTLDLQHIPQPKGPGTTVAAMDASKTMADIAVLAAERQQFSPQKWMEIARRGMELGSALHARGEHAQAEDVLRKAYNAQLLAQGAQQADTPAAIALSNLLGIVADPFAQQRKNMAAMEANPSLTFTPEEQRTMLGRNLPAATSRPFDVTKDVAAPLIGMAPTFELGGAVGRTALGAGGALLERAGAESIGKALGRAAQFGAEGAEMAGPSIPMRTAGLARSRIEEEVSQLRAALPKALTRGATQGQVVGALLNYRTAREQGATPEQALESAVMGAGLNVPIGMIGELAFGIGGRIAGVGYDPIGRLVGDVRGRVFGARGMTPEDAVMSAAEAPAMPVVDAQRLAEGRTPASDMMPGLHRDIAQSLDALLSQRRDALTHEYEDVFAERRPRTTEPAAGPEFWENLPPEELPRAEAGPRELGPEEMPSFVERPSVIGGRGRAEVPPPEPLPSALEAAMRRAGVEPVIRPSEEANAHYRMQRAAMDAEAHARAAAEEAQAALNDPNLRLEQAAQAAPGEKQGPLTLAQTLARAARDADAGDPMAQEYRTAIDRYVDAAATIRDLPKDAAPSTRQQIALARAKAGLDAARTKYGKQLGASAVLALAANNSDLDDEEKKWVGLGGLAILGTDVVKLDEDHPLVQRVPFYSRLRSAIDALPKKWDNPVPAADWIGKLKGTTTFKKEELALLLPALNDARRNGVKLSREDVRAIAEEKLPQIKRVNLAEQPSEFPNAYDTEGADTGDIHEFDAIEEAIGENPAAYSADDLRQQIANRQARITELRDEITERQNEAEREYDDAQTHTRNELEWVEEKVREAGLDDSMLEPALNFIRENTDSDGLHMPWRAGVGHERGDPIDHAMSLVLDDLYGSTDPASLLAEHGYTVNEEDQAPPERLRWLTVRHAADRGRDAPPLPYDLRERGLVSHRVLDDGRVEDTYAFNDEHTEQEHIEHAKHRHGDDAEVQFHDNADEIANFEPEDTEWVVRNSRGDEIARGDDEESVVQDAVESEGLESDHEELLSDVRRGLSDYADALAAELEKESEHNYLTENEDYAFDEQTSEIEQHEGEIEPLEALVNMADEREAAEAGRPAPEAPAPAEEPKTAEEEPEETTIPESHGSPKYATYQRIGGGRNYREMLNVWSNNPGDPYTANHYGGQGYSNVIGHVRAEDHTVPAVPGLTGDKVEFTGHETEEQRIAKSHIVEVRGKRDKLLKQMAAIVDEHAALPAEEQMGNRAEDMARRYADLNQQVIDLGKRENELVAKAAALLGVESKPKDVAVLVESQSDWAQDAGKEGLRQPVEPPPPEVVQAQRERIADLLVAASHADRTLNEARDHVAEIERKWNEDSWTAEQRQQYTDAANAVVAANPNSDISPTYIPGLHSLASPSWEAEWALVRQVRPDLIPLIEQAKAATKTVEDAEAAQLQAYDAHRHAEDALEIALGIGRNADQPPPTPFVAGGTKKVGERWNAEGKAAYTLNAARFLLDAAERGHTDIAWSDAANRVKNAHLPMEAAKYVYDDLTPSAMKSLLNAVGFKDVKMDKLYIRGEGHWHIQLTREMREAIKRAGLPILGVAGLMALTPSESEAQEPGRAAGPNLYGTTLGGIAAAAALLAFARDRRVRRLVKENRDLERALMVDDLSGLANKKAFLRARESVDNDPTYHWVVFDGDQFKALNDTHGHSEGDKAIQHFGRVIMRVADELQIPMRGFRFGGDEFAFAAPAEAAANFRNQVMRESAYTKGGVTTKLTGGTGPTFDAADAQLTSMKRYMRSGTPDRDPLPPPVPPSPSEHDAYPLWRKRHEHLAEESKQALANLDAAIEKVRDAERRATGIGDVPAQTAEEIEAERRRREFRLFSNPIAPALRELARYPSAAAVAGIGALATQSDDKDIRETGLPLIALAALNAIGSRRLAMVRDHLGQTLLSTLQRSDEGTAVARFFHPDALLHPDVRQAILDYEGTVAKGKARAAELGGQAKALGPQGDRAVSDVIENEGWEDVSAMPPADLNAVLTVAAGLEGEYSKLAALKVAHGVLDPLQLLPDYAGPRRYAFFEAADALKDNPRRGAGASQSTRIGAQKSRTLDEPIRDAQRALATAKAGGDPQAIQAAQDALDQAHAVQMSQRVERGEIREASYRAAQGIERGYADVAAAKLFQLLRAHPDVVHPEWATAVDDLDAAKKLRAGATTPADRDAADALVRDAKVRIDEITRRFEQKGGGWVSLPNSRGLGALRGAVVQRDVANSLTGFTTRNAYTKLLRAWKNVKTIFNPGTHAANIISNTVFAHMEGLPLWEQPVYLKRAAQEMRRYGPMTRALTEAGVLGHNVVNAEGAGALGRDMRTEEGLTELLGTTRPETAEVLRRQGITEERAAAKRRKRTAAYVAGGAALGAAKLTDDEDQGEGAAVGAALGAAGGYAAARIGRGITSLYGREDDIFRIAIGLKKLDQGLPMAAAVAEGKAALGNFRSRSPAIHLLRSSIAPFILYPAKVLPRFGKQVVDHPWRWMTLIALWGGLNEYSQHEAGDIPDIDVPPGQRRLMGYFLPGFTQLPLRDERGNRGATDIGRWTPISALTTGAPPGSIPAAFDSHIPDVFRAGGPVVDLAAKFGANIDPYSQEQVYRADYPPRENISKLLNDVSGTMLPSALDFHATRIKQDIANRDMPKLKNDVLGPTGLRPRFIRPGSNARSAAFELQQRLNDDKQKLTQELIANKNPARIPIIRNRYLGRVRQAIANYRDALGVAPPSHLVQDALDAGRAAPSP